MKNSFLTTSIFTFLVSSLTIANAQTTNQKTELKPVTTPLKKESPRFTAVERPINSSNKVTFTKVPSGKSGIRGTEIIGEGQYLNFDKKIRLRSVSGEIPVGFPKHIKGQSKADYISVMKRWEENNPDKVKPISYYLDYDVTIKAMSVTGQIPEGFPKHINGQNRQQYLKIMKNWAKNNNDKIKPEYWSTVNKNK